MWGSIRASRQNKGHQPPMQNLLRSSVKKPMHVLAKLSLVTFSNFFLRVGVVNPPFVKSRRGLVHQLFRHFGKPLSGIGGVHKVQWRAREQAVVERSRHAGCVVFWFRRKRHEELVEIVGDMVVEEDLKLGKTMTLHLAFVLLLYRIHYVFHRQERVGSNRATQVGHSKRFRARKVAEFEFLGNSLADQIRSTLNTFSLKRTKK